MIPGYSQLFPLCSDSQHQKFLRAVNKESSFITAMFPQEYLFQEIRQFLVSQESESNIYAVYESDEALYLLYKDSQLWEPLRGGFPQQIAIIKAQSLFMIYDNKQSSVFDFDLNTVFHCQDTNQFYVLDYGVYAAYIKETALENSMEEQDYRCFQAPEVLNGIMDGGEAWGFGVILLQLLSSSRIVMQLRKVVLTRSETQVNQFIKQFALKYELSQTLTNLLLSLLQYNPTLRISWYKLKSHPLMQTKPNLRTNSQRSAVRNNKYFIPIGGFFQMPSSQGTRQSLHQSTIPYSLKSLTSNSPPSNEYFTIQAKNSTSRTERYVKSQRKMEEFQTTNETKGPIKLSQHFSKIKEALNQQSIQNVSKSKINGYDLATLIVQAQLSRRDGGSKRRTFSTLQQQPGDKENKNTFQNEQFKNEASNLAVSIEWSATRRKVFKNQLDKVNGQQQHVPLVLVDSVPQDYGDCFIVHEKRSPQNKQKKQAKMFSEAQTIQTKRNQQYQLQQSTSDEIKIKDQIPQIANQLQSKQSSDKKVSDIQHDDTTQDEKSAPLLKGNLVKQLVVSKEQNQKSKIEVQEFLQHVQQNSEVGQPMQKNHEEKKTSDLQIENLEIQKIQKQDSHQTQTKIPSISQNSDKKTDLVNNSEKMNDNVTNQNIQRFSAQESDRNTNNQQKPISDSQQKHDQKSVINQKHQDDKKYEKVVEELTIFQKVRQQKDSDKVEVLNQPTKQQPVEFQIKMALPTNQVEEDEIEDLDLVMDLDQKSKTQFDKHIQRQQLDKYETHSYMNYIKRINQIGNMVASCIEIFEAQKNVWIIPLFLIFKRMCQLRHQVCDDLWKKINPWNIPDFEKFLVFSQKFIVSLTEENEIVIKELSDIMLVAKRKISTIDKVQAQKMDGLLNIGMQQNIRDQTFVYLYGQVYARAKINAEQKKEQKFSQLRWVRLQSQVLNSLIIMESEPYDDKEQVEDQVFSGIDAHQIKSYQQLINKQTEKVNKLKVRLQTAGFLI